MDAFSRVNASLIVYRQGKTVEVLRQELKEQELEKRKQQAALEAQQASKSAGAAGTSTSTSSSSSAASSSGRRDSSPVKVRSFHLYRW